MFNRIFQRGNRLFASASIMAIVIAVAHTSTLLNLPNDEGITTAFDVMKDTSVIPGSPKPNLLDVVLGLWLQVGGLLLLLGLKNLALLAVMPVDSSRNTIRTMSFVDGTVCAAMALLFLIVFIPPPLISFSILAVLFLFCGWKSSMIAKEKV